MTQPGTLATIGYLEPDAQARIEAFLARSRAYLVDIRLRPYLRFRPQWNRPALYARYRGRYVHLRGLGNVHYQDKRLPIHLLDPEPHIHHLAEHLTRGTSYLLLCACKDYERCHRKVVYERIMHTLLDTQPAEALSLPAGAVYAVSLWN
jgi:hypothetical protein